MSVDVAIVGGGVSGLATAWELQNKGFSVVVLERQVRVGGHALSENINGFVMEHGPSTVNAFDEHAQNVSTRLGLAAEQMELADGVKNRYLVSRGALKAIPISPLGFLTSDYMSLAGRVRMMMEPLMGRAQKDVEETIQQYTTRRFGAEFCDRIMDPLVGGLYAGRASELSMASVFPKMLDLEEKYGSVAKGMMMRRLKGGKMPGKRLFSWRDGIGTLPRTLAVKLEASKRGAVKTGVTVRAIGRRAVGYQLDCGENGVLSARAVVMATQPHVTSGLIEGLDERSAAAAISISTPPLAVVFLGYRRDQIDHPLDGLGFLAAQAENLGLTGVQFSSTMFAGRAPDNGVALTAYVGGARQPDLACLPENELGQLVQDRLRPLLGIRGAPVVTRVRHWNLGLPQYRIGHGDVVATLDATAQRTPGLYLTGNYLAGPAVAACLKRAGETADDVAGFLAAHPVSSNCKVDAHAYG